MAASSFAFVVFSPVGVAWVAGGAPFFGAAWAAPLCPVVIVAAGYAGGACRFVVVVLVFVAAGVGLFLALAGVGFVAALVPRGLTRGLIVFLVPAVTDIGGIPVVVSAVGVVGVVACGDGWGGRFGPLFFLGAAGAWLRGGFFFSWGCGVFFGLFLDGSECRAGWPPPVRPWTRSFGGFFCGCCFGGGAGDAAGMVPGFLSAGGAVFWAWGGWGVLFLGL
ncbi:Uncharacterised protein [Dermatophilus congolensis]|uniref:Uncharacterized protein n=1 Tax=Dermatophilus congolensis TaxID=1863 RepID=A0AA46BPY4_9MICO|nr:Uncharacterised protein [Dermatophilus congolensis]